MAEVIGVRFKDTGKMYYFDPSSLKVEKGQMVVVETARGLECGTVCIANTDVPENQIIKPLRKTIRIATDEDVKRAAENRRKEKEAFDVCMKKIAEHKLDMKLVDVEYSFDGSKILFYFTADGRIDFRNLVKDLASVFKTRIELRQIGVRDEAKLLGGMGICGQPFCCMRFLNEFQPVSIKMAKEQGLSLNPVKISGVCGRLMCCLKYEQDVYEELIGLTPKVGSVVKTPDGEGIVEENNILGGTVKVRLSKNPDSMPAQYGIADVKVLQSCPKRQKNKSDARQEQQDDIDAIIDSELLEQE